MSDLRTKIQSALEGEELVFLGAVPAHASPHFTFFQRWLEKGMHAEMHFLERYRDIRANPSLLLPGAKTCFLVGFPYYLGDSLHSDSPRIAQYARMNDYHRTLRKKLEKIAGKIFSDSPYRISVDSAPVLERALASLTADGFIGKNTCYIHRKEGSFLLLAEIFVEAESEFDIPKTYDLAFKTKEGGCGPCNLCQVACPTGALDEAYTLDARKCLAYWTIENRGTIPFEFWPHLSKYYFGCDLCQLACPYNKGAKRHETSRQFPGLFETATMDASKYEKYFGGTPLTRAKRGGLVRNALIAMTVTSDPLLESALDICRYERESPVPETLQQIYSYRAGVTNRDGLSKLLECQPVPTQNSV